MQRRINGNKELQFKIMPRFVWYERVNVRKWNVVGIRVNKMKINSILHAWVALSKKFDKQIHFFG